MRWRSARTAQARAAKRRARQRWQRSVRFHQARYEAATTAEDRMATAFDWFRANAGSGMEAGEVARSLASSAVELWKHGGAWDEASGERLERHQARYAGARGNDEKLRVAWQWYRAEVRALRRMFDQDSPDFRRICDAEMSSTADYLAGQAAQLARMSAPARVA